MVVKLCSAANVQETRATGSLEIILKRAFRLLQQGFRTISPAAGAAGDALGDALRCILTKIPDWPMFRLFGVDIDQECFTAKIMNSEKLQNASRQEAQATMPCLGSLHPI
jgi:hypothetical protein